MLFKLLASPIKLIKVIAEEAEKQFYDPKIILMEFQQLKQDYNDGLITEEQYKEKKKVLNQRLKNSEHGSPSY